MGEQKRNDRTDKIERVYVYGLCQKGVLIKDMWGLYGFPVTGVFRDEIGAIISKWKGENSKSTPENLMAHNNVLEIVSEDTAVLPVRFGTVLTTEALFEFIKKNYKKISENLAIVRGRIEMGLKVFKPGLPSAEQGLSSRELPQTGKAYMETLLARHQSESLITQEEENGLGEAAQRIEDISVSCRRNKTQGALLFNRVFLLEKEHIEEFYQIVKDAKVQYNDLLFLASGPWPPYSFACWEEG